MTIVEKLELVGFAVHEHSVFEFGRLNVVTGENSTGKTHVLEALEIALFCRQFPTSLIRDGCAEAVIRVWLRTEKGVRFIERSRAKADQVVTLRYEDGKTLEYVGAKDLTDIVQAFTGFADVKIDAATAENMQIRLRGELGSGMAAWNANPATILKRVTAVLSTHGFETAKKTLAKQVTDIADRQKVNVALRRKLLEEAETLRADPWPRIEEAVARLNELVKLRDDWEREAEFLARALDTARRAEKALETAKIPHAADKALRGLEPSVLDLKARIAVCDALARSLASARGAVASLESAESKLAARERELEEVRNNTFETCADCGRTCL